MLAALYVSYLYNFDHDIILSLDVHLAAGQSKNLSLRVDPVLHVAPLPATSFEIELIGPLRDALLQLIG